MKEKYNIGKHIDLDLIPNEDIEQALEEFSQGSFALKICLRVMWINNLKTYSCNPGRKSAFEIGHIVMEEGEDVFCYLSEKFLNDEKIRIDIKDNRQEIMFSGIQPEKEGVMLLLAREIQNGKKRGTSKLIEENIGVPFPTEWVRRLKTRDYNVDSFYWGEKVYIKSKNINK